LDIIFEGLARKDVMRKLSNKDLDEILGKDLQEFRQIMSKRLQEEEQKTTEDRYETSSLRTYFELDSWNSNQALLILCGIDPQAALIDTGYRNFIGGWINAQQIEHATFFGEADGYDTPSEKEIYSWIDDDEKDIKTAKDQIEGFKKYGDCICDEKDIPKIREQLAEAEASLEMRKEWLYDDSYNREWSTRSGYARKLTRIKAIWESGDHAERNTLNYFIDWAFGKGLEVSWLNWAQDQGFFPEITAPTNGSDGITSEYLRDLQSRVSHLEKKFPNWVSSTKVVQNTGNLIEWIKSETSSNTREAEIIKTALIEIIPELKKR
jgi:hypothetical protein